LVHIFLTTKEVAVNLLFRDIIGADRGFNTNADVLSTTADGVPLSSVWDEFQTALSMFNSTRNDIENLFTFNTTKTSDLIPLDGNKLDFEKSSEFGVPQSGRVVPNYMQVGYWFDWNDLASRYTWKFLANAPAEQVRSIQVAAQEADNRLIFNAIMTEIMTPTGGSYGARKISDEGHTVYSLYAGASDDRPPTAPDGTVFSAGHTHYLVSGGATVDSGDLDDLMTKVTEHGRGLRSSGEQLVILVNKQEGKVIRGFRVANGDTYDFIASDVAPAYLTSEVLVGSRPVSEVSGLPVIGSYGDALIVEHSLAKAGYMIAVASGGDKVLGFRQHAQTSYQGLLLVNGERAGFPLINSYYLRGFGLGVRNREAAAVMQIKASGTYTAPSWS
jgi:hypothetical protein